MWRVARARAAGVLLALAVLLVPASPAAARRCPAWLTKFDLVEAKGTSSGAVIATYRPAR